MTEVLQYGSWGRLFAPRHRVLSMRDRSEPLPLPDAGQSVLAYGAGRSYGDSCLNDGNALVRARDLDRFIAFDPQSGLLRCEAGVLLAEIIDFAMPRGFFPPVTPGSKFVTVGGAIANDVHGKNHHVAGSFGHYVPAFELLRSDGSRRTCSSSENAELYEATIGGLGLTGLITWADVRLRRVAGPLVQERAVRFQSLDDFFAISEPLEREHEYVVAWLDCVSSRAGGTRGVLFAGDHADKVDVISTPGRRRFPVTPPFSIVNGLTLRAFNQLYYRVPRGDGLPRLVTYDAFFYPLDGIEGWNRMYGPRGFFQYQCAVPEGAAGRDALARMIDLIAASGQGSFLAVLKRFGAMAPAGMMSFPRPGYTLALDFPNRGAETRGLLDRLDEALLECGGAVYPAKDSRMPAAVFQASFPRWQEFSGYVDPRFSSSFWRRVTGGAAMEPHA